MFNEPILSETNKLIRQIHDVPLIREGMVVLKVNVESGFEDPSFPFIAKILIKKGDDYYDSVNVRGLTPEGALTVAKYELRRKYGDVTKPLRRDISALTFNFFDGPQQAKPLFNLDKLEFWVPDHVELENHQPGCRCQVSLQISVLSDGTIGFTPEFHFCKTHDKAFEMEKKLKRIKKEISDDDCG